MQHETRDATLQNHEKGQTVTSGSELLESLHADTTNQSYGALTRENLANAERFAMLHPGVLLDGTIVDVAHADDIAAALRAIHDLEMLGGFGVANNHLTGVTSAAIEVLEEIRDCDDLPNVTKIMATHAYANLWLEYKIEGGLSEVEAASELDSYGVEIGQALTFQGAAQQHFTQHEVEVHNHDIPSNLSGHTVARGLIGMFDGHELIGYAIADGKDGDKIMSRIERENGEFHHSIGSLHDPYVMEYCRQMLGRDPAELTLDAQEILLPFVAKASTEETEHFAEGLRRIRDKTSADDYRATIDSLLSVEFGDDFSNRILAIAENDAITDAAKIFQDINDVRRAAGTIAPHFGELAPNIETAFVKRTTELLAIIADEKSMSNEIGDARQALRIVKSASQQIVQSVDQDITFDSRAMEAGVDYATLKSGATTMTIRPNGEKARIGFTVKIPSEILPESANAKDKRLSVRLDYDEFGLSLDIGSGAGVGINASPVAKFVGQQLAKGELRLMAQRQQVAIESGSSERISNIVLHGNHVREAFAGVDMTPEKFAELTVDFVDSLRVTEMPQRKENAT